MGTSKNPTYKIAELIVGELDHFKNNFHPQGGERTFHTQIQLTHEPFIGYVHVTDINNIGSKLLICRHYTPFNFKPRGRSVEFASYLSPLGRIIAKKPGQTHSFRIGGVSEDFRLIEKDDFTFHVENGLWDASNNQIAWIDGRMLARSLRKILEAGPEVEAKPDVEQVRQLRYSVQLPDQAILDQVQDEIFRLPLQARIRISGAPGTGKTTVLLKRLSQKTKREFLSDEESKSIKDQDWQDGRNWVLFTPSDLLKVYLKEAMAKELLPASDEHVKVYRTFRLELLREVGFIRVGQHGYFKTAAEGLQLMKRSTGGEQIALASAFGKFLAAKYAEAFRTALQKFNNETRVPLGKLSDSAQKVLNIALDILAKPLDDVIALRQAQQRAAGYRKLNEDLNKLLNSVRAVGALENAGMELSLSRIYRQARLLPGILDSLTTANIEVALFPEIPSIVEQLRRDVKDLSETFTLSRLFQIIPRAYQEFRETPEELKRFFLEESEKSFGDRVLSEAEQDVLLFHALEFVRELADELPPNLANIAGEVRVILNRMRILVCVDEATDFSPLEIACIERLAKQSIGGVTICGDLMQRVTEQGLKEWTDLEKISGKYDGYELRISYRQSERLFAIAKDLYRHVRNIEPDFSSAFRKRAEDPPPLLYHSTTELSAEQWLTARICEIHALCGQHLPTTAILVAHQDDVEPLRKKLKPLLMENGLELEASHGGQALGDSARVRIFPVEFIKGLEFEAVFYVGLDRMAEIHRDLIDKYVYVGLSRARSFLGVTVERQFPQRFQCIANHFIQDGSWNSSA
jgi:superfamily I DNA/RNA helicase